MIKPNYHCPICETLSTLIIGPEQAFCTNTEGCKVITFNPSLPDRGLSNVHFIDFDLNDDDRQDQSCNTQPGQIDANRPDSYGVDQDQKEGQDP
jgi:hypothetical protein